MSDKPINLSDHRDKADRKSTRKRLRHVKRLLLEQKKHAENQKKIEKVLLSAPAETWPEAGAHALYLIRALSASARTCTDSQKRLIEQTVSSLECLCAREV